MPKRKSNLGRKTRGARKMQQKRKLHRHLLNETEEQHRARFEWLQVLQERRKNGLEKPRAKNKSNTESMDVEVTNEYKLAKLKQVKMEIKVDVETNKHKLEKKQIKNKNELDLQTNEHKLKKGKPIKKKNKVDVETNEHKPKEKQIKKKNVSDSPHTDDDLVTNDMNVSELCPKKITLYLIDYAKPNIPSRQNDPLQGDPFLRTYSRKSRDPLA